MRGWGVALTGLVALLMASAIALAAPGHVEIHRYAAGEPGGSGVGVRISRRFRSIGCDGAAPGAALTISGHGHLFRAHTPSLCNGHWRQRGRVPGVRFRATFWAERNEAGTTVVLLPNYGTVHAKYRFVLRSGDQRVTGHIVVDHVEAGEERIYQGSEAFVDYCIDRDREIRSFGGRHYCDRVFGEHGYLKLRYSSLRPSS